MEFCCINLSSGSSQCGQSFEISLLAERGGVRPFGHLPTDDGDLAGARARAERNKLLCHYRDKKSPRCTRIIEVGGRLLS